MCPESGQTPQECCLRVSLMPLRLNIDQVKDMKDFSTVSKISHMSSVNCL